MTFISTNATETDSIPPNTTSKTIHRIEVQAVPSAIFHTNSFLEGDNNEMRTMNHDQTYKLNYAFQKPHNQVEAHIYNDNYQGIGLAWHHLNPQLGNPVTAYIFQGARIANLSHRLSLNYEWNLGLTFGWRPYDEESNPENRVIGSKVTAYINAEAYLAYRLSKQFDVNLGVALSHFSNGNTSLPNAGLNTIGARVGLAYYVNREEPAGRRRMPIPPFKKHVSYDLLFYGAWCKIGFYADDGPWILPEKFGVYGFSFSPLYNLNHWFAAGLALDGVYNRSANLDTDELYNDQNQLLLPPARRQMALGLSGHAEFIMPYFTINLGLGKNIVNDGGSFSGIYETVALKIGVTRHAFINIGYSLRDFKSPNHLMIGAGIRFNHQRRR